MSWIGCSEKELRRRLAQHCTSAELESILALRRPSVAFTGRADGGRAPVFYSVPGEAIVRDVAGWPLGPGGVPLFLVGIVDLGALRPEESGLLPNSGWLCVFAMSVLQSLEAGHFNAPRMVEPSDGYAVVLFDEHAFEVDLEDARPGDGTYPYWPVPVWSLPLAGNYGWPHGASEAVARLVDELPEAEWAFDSCLFGIRRGGPPTAAASFPGDLVPLLSIVDEFELSIWARPSQMRRGVFDSVMVAFEGA